MTDPMPTYDRCPHCGREGRAMTNPANFANLIGSKNRVLPLRELELEIATHVGAATLKAGELDAAMAGLIAVARPVDPSAISATWGRSGKELTRTLRKVATGPDVDVREELESLCERYDALYETRNALIHSFRPGRGSERLDVVKAIRIKGAEALANADNLTERRRLGLSELVDLYYGIDGLIDDARNLYLRAIGAVD